MFDIYEDKIRLEACGRSTAFVSRYQDFRYYGSSVTPGTALAMNVIKPEQPSPMLVQLHGWHMSMPEPCKRESPVAGCRYLVVQVDMRGRAFSEGSPDCNGHELIDIYDAVRFVREQYPDYLSDPGIVHLEGGSGGGGNALAMINKFPDLFASATALYGISDYAEWYAGDRVGEFRDEMDVWIGSPPWNDAERYAARSGAYLAANQLTSLLMAHGSYDERVPVGQSRRYVSAGERAGKEPLIRYVEWPGVGGFEHTERLPDASLQAFEQDKERHRSANARSLEIPRQGVFMIGGYLYTKHFAVHMEHIDCFARLVYDLDEGLFRVTAERPYSFRIELADGTVRNGTASVEA
ncbi:alpha/beta hydrolase family protein [Paenibacillus sp. MBLB4367]|uniref:alpha/beta hydrolase family protein n=1 Tax=Paenibacillus sp. MBLB4367 TaxID=3384767 RepID=UPI00390821E1